MSNIFKDEKRARSFIISYYAIGFAGMALPFTRPVFEQLTGLTIIISFGLIMIFHQGWSLRFILTGLFIYVAGFAFEAAGVQTGAVFGHYSYHSSLGPKLLDTPLIIGINWLMLVYAIYHLTLKLKIHKVLLPLLNASLMVVYDIILEPIAIGWNMWEWTGGSVPVQNYVAWFLISLIFFFLMQLSNLKYRNKISTLILIAQVVFFLLLHIVNQF